MKTWCSGRHVNSNPHRNHSRYCVQDVWGAKDCSPLIPTVSILSWYLMLVLIGGYNNLFGWTIHATVGIVFVAGGASVMMSVLSDSDFALPQEQVQ